MHAQKYAACSSAAKALFQMEKDKVPENLKSSAVQVKNFRPSRAAKDREVLSVDYLQYLWRFLTILQFWSLAAKTWRQFAWLPPPPGCDAPNVAPKDTFVPCMRKWLFQRLQMTTSSILSNLQQRKLYGNGKRRLQLAIRSLLEERAQVLAEIQASSELIDRRLQRQERQRLVVQGDGNCQFAAVLASAQLDMSVAQLREPVVASLAPLGQRFRKRRPLSREVGLVPSTYFQRWKLGQSPHSSRNSPHLEEAHRVHHRLC